MPLLPLPIGGAAIDGGDLPVSDDSDVLEVFPYAQRSSSDPAPVRDAIVALEAATFIAHQNAASYAAGQSDPLRATDFYLDGLLEDHGCSRQRGESDEDYLARYLAGLQVVTPAAIMASVNAILAPVTASQAQYFEASLDRMFITDGTASFRSFVEQAPQYQDRLFPEDTATPRPQSNPGSSYIFSDDIGRFFLLRVPDLAGLDEMIQLAYNGTKLDPSDAAVPELGGALLDSYDIAALGQDELAPNLGGTGLFITNGSNASGSEADGSVATFLTAATTDSLTTYNTIASTVERIRGQSIRWALIVDPAL